MGKSLNIILAAALSLAATAHSQGDKGMLSVKGIKIGDGLEICGDSSIDRFDESIGKELPELKARLKPTHIANCTVKHESFAMKEVKDGHIDLHFQHGALVLANLEMGPMTTTERDEFMLALRAAYGPWKYERSGGMHRYRWKANSAMLSAAWPEVDRDSLFRIDIRLENKVKSDAMIASMEGSLRQFKQFEIENKARLSILQAQDTK